MARIRAIKPDAFDDVDLNSLPFPARWLFAGLWCWADREGRLRDEPPRIKAHVLPYDDVDCESLLQLLSPRFIDRYEIDGRRYIQIRNFEKHQHPHPKEAESEIPRNIEQSSKAVESNGPAVKRNGGAVKRNVRPRKDTAGPCKEMVEPCKGIVEPRKDHDEQGGSGSGSWILDPGSSDLDPGTDRARARDGSDSLIESQALTVAPMPQSLNTGGEQMVPPAAPSLIVVPPPFTAFWASWPESHRVGRKQAVEQWEGLPSRERIRAEAEVRWRVEHDPVWQSPGEDGRWRIPHPFRYLRDKRFTDARPVAPAPRMIGAGRTAGNAAALAAYVETLAEVPDVVPF